MAGLIDLSGPAVSSAPGRSGNKKERVRTGPLSIRDRMRTKVARDIAVLAIPGKCRERSPLDLDRSEAGCDFNLSFIRQA
jgi:hypothetical protein